MQIDDMKAIDQFFRQSRPINSNALSISMAWRTWYDDLSTYAKTFDSDVLAQARAKRDAYNRANVTPKTAAAQTAAASKAVMSDLPSSSSKALKPGTRPTIKKGSPKSPAVIEWQQFLGVTADGIFGSGTEAATKAFQSRNGLAADGVVGPNTWGKAIGVSSGSAAVQAANMVADASAKAVKAVANKAPAVKASTAASQSVKQTMTQNATAAAQKAVASLPSNTPTPAVASQPVMTAAKAAVAKTKAKVKAVKAVTPIWTQFAVGTVGIIALLTGAKVFFGGKRAA